jgi:hypothetical protein
VVIQLGGGDEMRAQPQLTPLRKRSQLRMATFTFLKVRQTRNIISSEVMSIR